MYVYMYSYMLFIRWIFEFLMHYTDTFLGFWHSLFLFTEWDNKITPTLVNWNIIRDVFPSACVRMSARPPELRVTPPRQPAELPLLPDLPQPVPTQTDLCHL